MLNLFGLSLDTRQRGVSLTVDEPRLRLPGAAVAERDESDRPVYSLLYFLRPCLAIHPPRKFTIYTRFIRQIYVYTHIRT